MDKDKQHHVPAALQSSASFQPFLNISDIFYSVNFVF